MADVAFVRLTLGGPLSGGEEWSCGMSFLADPDNDSADLNAWLDTVEPLVETHLGASGGTKSLMSPQSGITTMRAALYVSLLKTAVVTADKIMSSGVAGNGSNPHPNQCALAISFHTGFSGRRFNGRIFWPADGANMGSTHQIDATLTIAAADHVANFLTAVNATSIGATPTAAVIAVPGPGPAQLITSVSADSVVDTQRRRRNKVAAVAKATQPVT